jgi:hypothetical protein
MSFTPKEYRYRASGRYAYTKIFDGATLVAVVAEEEKDGPVLSVRCFTAAVIVDDTALKAFLRATFSGRTFLPHQDCVGFVWHDDLDAVMDVEG